MELNKVIEESQQKIKKTKEKKKKLKHELSMPKIIPIPSKNPQDDSFRDDKADPNRNSRRSKVGSQSLLIGSNQAPLSNELPIIDMSGSIIGQRVQDGIIESSPLSNIQINETPHEINIEKNGEKFIFQTSINESEQNKGNLEIKSSILDIEILNQNILNSPPPLRINEKQTHLQNEKQFNNNSENENELQTKHTVISAKKLIDQNYNNDLEIIRPKINQTPQKYSQFNLNSNQINEDKMNRTINTFMGRLNNSFLRKTMMVPNPNDNLELNLIHKGDIENKRSQICIEEQKSAVNQKASNYKIKNLFDQAKILDTSNSNDFNVQDFIWNNQTTNNIKSPKIEKEFFHLVILRR